MFNTSTYYVDNTIGVGELQCSRYTQGYRYEGDTRNTAEPWNRCLSVVRVADTSPDDTAGSMVEEEEVVEEVEVEVDAVGGCVKLGRVASS